MNDVARASAMVGQDGEFPKPSSLDMSDTTYPYKWSTIKHLDIFQSGSELENNLVSDFVGQSLVRNSIR